MINPKLKEIIVKSLDRMDFYLEGLKISLNEKMHDILKKINIKDYRKMM